MRDSLPVAGAALAGVATAWGVYAAWPPALLTLLWGLGCGIMSWGLVDRLRREARAA